MTIHAQALPITALAERRRGRPFATLRTGPVYSRFSGEQLAIVTEADLDEMVRIFEARADADPVVIDWQHATSPLEPLSGPEVSMPLGRIVAVVRDGDALVVTPEYNERGLKVVRESDGDLWSSPEFVTGRTVYAREAGDELGTAQLLAVTLTPRPQQTASVVDAVRLNETAPTAAQEEAGMPLTPEYLAEVEAERDALKAVVAELEAKLAAMESEAEDEADAEAMAEPEPVVAALREQLDTRDGEVTTLREQVDALNADLTALREENYTTRRAAAIDALISAGKVTPAEREAVERAYDVEHRHPEVGYAAFSEHYANRGVVVPTGVVGTSGSDDALTAADAATRLKEAAGAIREATGLNHADAMRRAMNDNPELAAAALN